MKQLVEQLKKALGEAKSMADIAAEVLPAAKAVKKPKPTSAVIVKHPNGIAVTDRNGYPYVREKGEFSMHDVKQLQNELLALGIRAGAKGLNVPLGEAVDLSKFKWLHGLNAKSFPVQSGRYGVTSLDRSQSPSVEDHGQFDSIDAAGSYALKLLPNSADSVTLWDSKRGYAVAKAAV